MYRIFYILGFVLLFVGSTQKTIAQKKARITVAEKNGDITHGWGRLSSSGKINIVPDSLGIQKLFFLSNLDYARVNGKKYRQLPVEGKPKPVIVELKIEGDLSLYYKMKTGFSSFSTPGGGTSSIATSYKHIYLKRKNDKSMTHLGSDRVISKSFKKGAVAYFEDCPELVQKIESKEFRKKHIWRIVNFYNRNCTGE